MRLKVVAVVLVLIWVVMLLLVLKGHVVSEGFTRAVEWGVVAAIKGIVTRHEWPALRMLPVSCL